MFKDGTGRRGTGRGGGLRKVTGTNSRNGPAHAHLKKNSLRNLHPRAGLSYTYVDGIILYLSDGLQKI